MRALLRSFIAFTLAAAGAQALADGPSDFVTFGDSLSDTGNLFVPFFSTKATGSGIGLVLSRQIAEAHGGSVVLRNRADRVGCEAVLRLPAEGYAPRDRATR